MPVCSFFSCCSSFYFHVGKFKRKQKIKSNPHPHMQFELSKNLADHIRPWVELRYFLLCFSFFLHLWFFGFYICDLFSFLHLCPKVFYICDSVFFHICDIFFTYDVEFLHLAFLFFTYVAVVTFVTVFTFKVLTTALSLRVLSNTITVIPFTLVKFFTFITVFIFDGP